MQANPFRFGQALNLKSFGVVDKSLKFGVTTLESEKYVCVYDKEPNDSGQITIVELANKSNVVRLPGGKIDAALMHISQNYLAVRSETDKKTYLVQIYNLVPKIRVKLKSVELPEQIIFWRWVNVNILGVVTSNSVYHINISNDSKEVKVFDIVESMKNDQIIGYSLSPDEKWGALTGLFVTNEPVKVINGHIQLYWIDGGKQQLLEGHSCTFGRAYVHNETHKSNIFSFVEKKQSDKNSTMHISQISGPPQGITQKFKKLSPISIQNQDKDFPISLVVAEKFGLIYVVTKLGVVYVYEITSCEQLYKVKIATSPIFAVAKNYMNDGLLAITKSGSLHVGLVEQGNLINFLLNSCRNIQNIQQIAYNMACRYSLPGVDGMLTHQFNNFINQGDYASAAKIASMSPGTLLRNQETILRFRSFPTVQGQPQPLLIYFQKLLERGQLTKLQTMELCQPVLAQGKIDLVKNWSNGGKLDNSEEFGDLVAKYDKAFALKIYQDGQVHKKVIQIMNEQGRVEEATKYAQAKGIPIDYTQILRSMVDTNPTGALDYSKKLYEKDKNLNIHQIADLFLQRNRIQQFTSLLFDCMRDNKPEDAPYQTKVLQLNIMIAPQIFQSILQMKIWKLYNKQKIGNLCQQKALYQRALQNYTDLRDIKRVLLNSHAISPDFIADYLGRMNSADCLACMTEMMRFNRQNIQTVVNVAVKNLSNLGAGNIVKMFESVGSYDGIFYFLGTVINSTTDKEVHHKYIEAAAKCGQFKTIEDVVKSKRDCYDPARVKSMLLEMKLTDPRPLIYLCDVNQQYQELTKYLYKNNAQRYIEIYLFRVCQNPKAIPIVLGTLIDLECDESYIKQILKTIRTNVPMEELVEQFQRRNKLSILESWLEERVSQNVQIPAIHNAMARIKIDTNQNPQQFLTTNQFYDQKVVGKFCQQRDPHLAVIAYRRNPGTCDEELIQCTNKNSLYRIQAQYLVQRMSPELWRKVLSPDNQHRKEIIDQVVSTALPESKQPEEVIIAVQAFMEAELTVELMALLEKIVLHNSDFSQYKKLQNLLIITAIKSDQSRVMDYINRLDNYDGPQMAQIAMGDNYRLYEEALTIYKRKNMHNEAIEVLISKINDLQRAEDYAEKVNEPSVWSKLGETYLNNGNVVNAMDAFMKCKDHTFYLRVIGLMESEEEGEEKDFKYQPFIKYLLMVRDATKDVAIDNALTFAYSKLGKLQQLQNFLSNNNSTDCQKVGDRCYNVKLYEAAKMFYTIAKNNSKIASCLIKLKEYSAAIEIAKKANTTKTWKELCMACVAAQQYKLANAAAMNIIVHPDELQGLIKHYESLGVVQEMINLLETGVGLERAHIGIFTELAILYAKHKPEKLMQHCKTYMQKLNITKLLRACQKFMLWKQAVFLYSHYNEFDQAVTIMMQHSPIAFIHQTFIQLITKVSNNQLYYKSINFYLEEQPLQLNELLKALANKIDLVKSTTVIRKLGIVQLVQPFLKIVQQTNTKQVNEALNELYLNIEDYQSLRQSITQFPNFDSYNLAKATQNHELLQFRRVAAYLYRKNGKFQQSINLSKKDEMYRDAIETAQQADNPKIVQDLLKFFVELKQKEFFAATLYTCYDYLRPDLVLEYAWRFNMYEFCMPYMIQLISELKTRVETVHKKNEDREKKDEQQAKQKMNQPLGFDSDVGMMISTQQMLTGPGMFNSTPGYNPNLGGYSSSNYRGM